jgi:hypothetical protein
MRRIWKIAVIGLLIGSVWLPAYGAPPPEEGKSIGKAMLLSLLLPGAGEYYLGYQGRAKLMFVSEAGIWSAFGLYRVQGRMREDRYKELARLFADVEHDMGDEYYRILSYYPSSDDYNIDVMREARFRYPDDRARQLEYVEANGYFGVDAWQWESLEKQAEFADTRTRSRESYRRAVLTTGFAVLNRMVSLIDIYLSFKLAPGDQHAAYPRLRMDSEPHGGFSLYLTKSF